MLHGKGRKFNITRSLEMLQALVDKLLDQGHFASIVTGDSGHVRAMLKKNAETLCACPAPLQLRLVMLV
jgi:hypothetical protein